MVDLLSVVLRAASFVLLFQAAGTALFIAFFGERIPQSAAAVRRIGRVSAALALVTVAGHYALEAGRMAGELPGVANVELQVIALHSSTAAEAALRMLGLGVIATALRGSGRLAGAFAVVGATLTVVAFALTGHTAVSPERSILVVALTVHVLIVAFWFGALPALHLATRLEPARAASSLLAAFSLAATWIVPGLFLAGVILTAGLVPGLATFAHPYGELLLAKIAGFALLMMLAALNKWRLTRALASGESRAAVALRRSVAAEYVLIVGVLTATAVMTTYFSPD